MERLLRRMDRAVPLSCTDREEIRRLATVPIRVAGGGAVESDENTRVVIVEEGWAYRQRLFEDGRRQITALYLPGDICDVEMEAGHAAQTPLIALSACRFQLVDRAELAAVCAKSPRLELALSAQYRARQALLLEWLVSLGRRSALERLAYLFYEILTRQHVVGLASECTCPMLLTQSDVGDATGLSIVHVNRTLQTLRSRQGISWRRRELTIRSPEAIRRAAMLAPADAAG